VTDWKEVAAVLALQAMPTYGSNADLYAAAIRLCELASLLPEGEAERLLTEAVEYAAWRKG
jgi:hypothetical protein